MKTSNNLNHTTNIRLKLDVGAQYNNSIF